MPLSPMSLLGINNVSPLDVDKIPKSDIDSNPFTSIATGKTTPRREINKFKVSLKLKQIMTPDDAASS